MDKSLDFSGRCSRLFFGVKVYADISGTEFNSRCGFQESFSVSLWRLLRGHKSAVWTPELAEPAAEASSQLISIPYEDIWRHLNGQPVEQAARLRELELSYLWFPRPTVGRNLARKLRQYEQDAKQIIGVQRFLPASLTNKPIYRIYNRNLTADWGDFGRRALTVMNDFWNERRLQSPNVGEQVPGRSKVLIMLSEFEQAMALKGPLHGAVAADLHDCLDGLDKAICRLNFGIVLIDDSRFPRTLARHYAHHDAVVTFDNLFVMKIRRRSLVRSWCERSAGPNQDHAIYIDHELKMIDELLTYRTHDLTKSDMAEALKKFRPTG